MKAKLLGDVADALEDVKQRLGRFLRHARKITARRPRSLGETISMLRDLRRETYEDLNQLQHEYMVLAAIEWLIRNKHCPASTKWYCHLQQTSAKGESDLIGKFGNRYIVWAEVSASENPEGSIDGRIRNALKSVAYKPSRAKKFYFVRTDAMRKRAQTKVRKNDWKIEVAQLDV